MLFTLLTLLYDCIICSIVTSKGPHWQLHYHSLYSVLALVVFIAFDTTRHYIMGASQVALVVKNLAYKRHGFNPQVGKIPGGGHGKPFQYSCLENPMDRGA